MRMRTDRTQQTLPSSRALPRRVRCVRGVHGDGAPYRAIDSGPPGKMMSCRPRAEGPRGSRGEQRSHGRPPHARESRETVTRARRQRRDVDGTLREKHGPSGKRPGFARRRHCSRADIAAKHDAHAATLPCIGSRSRPCARRPPSPSRPSRTSRHRHSALTVKTVCLSFCVFPCLAAVRRSSV